MSSFSNKIKAQTAEGRRILSILNKKAGFSEDMPLENVLSGKPFFKDNRADFNISHSGKLAAAAWLSKGRVGCDIQFVDSKPRIEIARRCFHAGELEELRGRQNRDFFRIWVLKEAWLKMYGFSVFEMAKAPMFSIEDSTRLSGEKVEDLRYFLYELENKEGDIYTLAVICDYLSADEPEFFWFSDTEFKLKRVENIYAAHIPENTDAPKI